MSISKVNYVKILQVIFYSTIFTIGLNIFLIPMNLISTGLSGVAQILSHFTHISYGIIYAILNIPGIILGFNKLGYKFTLYSLISILTVTIVSSIIPEKAISNDIIINCVFGGITMGIGMGNLLRIGSSTGGTDFYGIWAQRYHNMDFSKINFVSNVIIICVAALLFGVEIGLYTLLSFYIRNLTMKQIFVNNNKMTVWIIGDDLTRVSTYINQYLKHGTTIIEGHGGYTQDEKEIIMTILTQYEYSILRENIYEICPNAFINVTETYDIGGNFRPKRNS